MIIKRNEAHTRNMKIVAVLGITCLLAPLYFYNAPQGHMGLYAFIFLPFAFFFAFQYMIMHYLRNEIMELTDQGLFVNHFMRHPIPWENLQSAHIGSIGTANHQYLEVVFNHYYIDSERIGLKSKHFINEKTMLLCSLGTFTLEPYEILNHVNNHIKGSA